jgi:hypothetical protein
VYFSFNCDPNAKPSDQLRALAAMNRPELPLAMQDLKWSARLTFDEMCNRIDGPYCELKVLTSLVHYLRCERRYLKDIHNTHRRFVLRVSDREAKKVGKARQLEERKMYADDRPKPRKTNKPCAPKPEYVWRDE